MSYYNKLLYVSANKRITFLNVRESTQVWKEINKNITMYLKKLKLTPRQRMNRSCSLRQDLQMFADLIDSMLARKRQTVASSKSGSERGVDTQFSEKEMMHFLFLVLLLLLAL
jgi:hypothetical protein